MNGFPFGGVIPGPVEFGVVGGAGWIIVAIAAAMPVALAAHRWFEIGIRESLNALVDLATPAPAERRSA
jgi:hypothetical protein